MKKVICILLFYAFIGSCYAEDFKVEKFPSSDIPLKFHQEVKNYIIYSSQFGLDVSRHRKMIESDQKDWETPLAEIIINPREYKIGPTEAALLAATIRKKQDNPKIHRATARLFEEAIKISVEKFDQAPEDRSQKSTMNTWISILIAEIVELESPDALQSILVFLHSPEVDRFETLQAYDPNYIAPALQKFGDLRNAEEALKVAAKLESIARSDVAADIKRAAERIKKEAAKKQAASTGGSNESSNDASAPDGEATKSASEMPLWPWLAAGGALLAAVIGYFRMKRAGA